MKTTTRQRRMVLGRKELLALISDPDFYTECPVFSFLQDGCLQSIEAYNESARGRCCGGVWAYVRPAVDGICRAIKVLHEQDPEYVEPVRRYLEKKHGYPPKPVVIYYRTSKGGRPVRFQF